MDPQDELVSYYRAELESLHRAGTAFAQRYPRIAGKLELGASGSTDPHVERLIESFAFLTARLQKRLDDRFPELTTGLLGVLYPNLAQAIPPMTIAEFTVDPKRGKLLSGHPIPRGTRLFTSSGDGQLCRFATSYAMTLWPLRVAAAGFVPRAAYDFLEHRSGVQSVLRVRLEPLDCALDELKLSTLRFHLAGEAQMAGMLYEMLLGHVLNVALYDGTTGKAVLLGKDRVRAAGFADDEEVIPCPPQSHPAYRLLQEYFTLPQKFLFFDVDGLDRNPNPRALELLFLLDTLPRERQVISAANFRIGCTPVINLFSQTSEPIRIDHRRAEYRLIADQRRERITEIHSVTSVVASADARDSSATLRPFYDFSEEGSSTSAFWHARQEPALDSTMDGTDTSLSFVDLEFNPRLPPSETVYAHVLCTNRGLAGKIPEGAELSMEEPAPLHSIRCLARPTPTAYPPLGGSSQWALISNLSLNHLSLDHGAHSLAALKKMLKLYSLSDSPEITRQIEGIRALTTRDVVRRVGAGWQGWANGRQTRLELDESFYGGVSLYLFASVLREFFALYGSTSSFSELVIETTQKSVTHRFAALPGRQPRF
jgi:type VI secretion system protein ImpG